MNEWNEIDNKILDPAWYTQPEEFHRVFKELRDDDPVHWTENDAYGRHHWTLTRYDHVKEYLLDPARFSSREDSRVPRSPKRKTPEERHAQGWDTNIATIDDPYHNLYRRPINKHFSVPAIAKMSDDVDRIVDEILADISERGTCDLVEDIAAQVPGKVVFRLLGVPECDWGYLQEASWQWLAAADPRYIIDGDELATSLYGQKKILDYCTDLALERRKDPRDDFATTIAQMLVDGDALSTHEMKVWFMTMIGGGLETTRNAGGVGLWLFMNNPEQRALLMSDPDKYMKGAIEEVMRWASPAKNRLRVATEDFDFHGKRIRTGDWVIALLVSANHDERVFNDPGRFDITRTPNPHLALGEGIHLCLGRNLARLELSALFRKVLGHLPDMRPQSSAVNWIADRSVTGFTDMPVEFTPRKYTRQYAAVS
jgi:cholest-4-en-3-one 26-monooxygenase